MRPSWDEWALGLAAAVATRGDCSRRQVGAVILNEDHTVASVGYNGSWRGGPSCLAGECPRAFSNVEPGSSYDSGPGMCHAQHAEQNACANAKQSVVGCTIYVSEEPCAGCIKTLRSHRIARVVWPTGMRELP